MLLHSIALLAHAIPLSFLPVDSDASLRTRMHPRRATIDQPLGQMASGVKWRDPEPGESGVLSLGIDQPRVTTFPRSNAERGSVKAVTGLDEQGRKVVVVDTDTDGDWQDEVQSIFPKDGEHSMVCEVTYEEGEGQRVRETSAILQLMFGTNTESRWLDMWCADVRVGSEVLRLAAGQVGPNAGVLFADASGDGIYDQYLDQLNRIGFAGRFYTLSVDWFTREVVLTPSETPPVEVGFAAPNFVAERFGEEGTFELAGHKGGATLLAFTHRACFACVALKDDFAKLAKDFAENESVQLVSVVQEVEDAELDLVPGFQRLVAPEVWQRYGVTPTPVFVLVGPDGVIAGRMGGRHRGEAHPMLKSAIEAALKEK